MDLLAILIVVFLSAVVFLTKENRMSKALFFLTLMTLGVLAQVDGEITYNGVVYIDVETDLGLMTFMILTFGSLIGMISSLMGEGEKTMVVGKKEEDDD